MHRPPSDPTVNAPISRRNCAP